MGCPLPLFIDSTVRVARQHHLELRTCLGQEGGLAWPGMAGRGYTYATWLAVGAYVVGVGLRVAQGICAPLTTESAYGGLMGLRLLAGHWPFFFYGQNWMGGYDAILQAVVYALAGPTALGLVGWAVVLNLLTMVMVHRLLLRWVGRDGAWAGLWWMAVPPAVGLFWCTYPNLHYPLCIALGAALMLLSVRIWQAPRPWWELGLWGVVAGAGIYTNFQFVVVAVPCGVLIGFRLWVWRGLWAAVAGVMLGAGPLLCYELTHNWPHLAQASAFVPGLAAAHLRAFVTNALPLVLGLPTPVACGPVAPGQWMYIVAMALGVVGAGGAGALAMRARRDVSALLPVGVGLANIAATIFTVYGVRLSSNALAYLLPLIWLAMPFFWAALAGLARGRWRWVAAGLMGVVVGCSVWGYRYYCRGEFHVLRPAEAWVRSEPRRKALARVLRAAGVGYVYMNCASVVSFYSYPWPLLSDPWQERVVEIACKVDASLCPWWAARGAWSPIAFLGVPRRMMSVGGLRLMQAGAPLFKGAQLTPRGWRARTLSGRDLGTSLWDLDMATGFSTPSRAREGEGFVVDLGRVRMLSGLAMVMSDFRDCPAGLKVEAAASPGRWRTLASTTRYWGPMYASGPHPFLKARYPRIECYFPPTPARWVRVTHLGRAGRPWRFCEFILYKALPAPHPGRWASTAAAIVEGLKRAKIRRVYADAWAAAVICSALADVSCIPPNRSTDDYGADIPPHTRPIPLNIDQATALVVDGRDAPKVIGALKAAGFSLRVGRLGHMRLILPSPPQIHAWAKPQRLFVQGRKVELLLPRPMRLGWIRLRGPRCLGVAVAGPGGRWVSLPLNAAGPLVFTGQLVAAGPGPVRTWRVGTGPLSTRVRLVLASPALGTLSVEFAPAED